MLKITLVKSLIAQKPAKKATAATLGLKKIGDTALHAEGPAIDGKIAVISHLVKIEKVED